MEEKTLYADVQFVSMRTGLVRGERRYSFMTTIDDLVDGDFVQLSTSRGISHGVFRGYTEFNDQANAWILEKLPPVPSDAFKPIEEDKSYGTEFRVE